LVALRLRVAFLAARRLRARAALAFSRFFANLALASTDNVRFFFAGAFFFVTVFVVAATRPTAGRTSATCAPSP
jgi:hypothetical protein